MKGFIQIFLLCAAVILVPFSSFAAGNDTGKRSETISIVYSGDLQGQLLPKQA